MRLITRAEWGARHGDGVDDRPLPATEAYLHHSVTIAPDLQWVDADGDNVDDDEEAAMRTIEDIGAQRFGTAYGFPYTFAVMPRGDCAYHGHRVGQMGAHTYGHNDTAVGIVLVGNYDEQRPTEAQLDTVAWLLRRCVELGWLREPKLTGGHRDVKATACPGQHAYDLIPEINRRAQEDDMYGDKDRERDEEVAKQIATIHTQVKDLHATWRKGIPKERMPGVGFLTMKNIERAVAALAGKLAALQEAQRQHNAGGQLDLAKIEAAAQRGTTKALESGVVDVDITVNDRTENTA